MLPIKNASFSLLIILLVMQGGACESVDTIEEGADINTGTTTLGAGQGTFQVAGLNYITATHSGTTDKSAAFLYEPGETVEFFLGDMSLGSVLAKPNITMFDLTGFTNPPVGNKAIVAAVRTPSFRRLVNMSVLLATLDDNRNLSDGVYINPQVANLFNGLTMDFEQSIERFTKGTITLGIMDTQINGLFEVSPQLVTAPAIMQILYNSIGLDANVMGLNSFNSFRLDKGLKDSQSTTEYSYDFFGNTIQRTYNGSGYAQKTDREYDANGNLLHEMKYTNNQGKEKFKESSSVFNLLNNVMRYVRILDGVEDLVVAYSYSYDNRGNNKSIVRNGRVVSFDYDNSGNKIKAQYSPTSSRIYKYNSNNKLIMTRQESTDSKVDSYEKRLSYGLHGVELEEDYHNESLASRKKFNTQGSLVSHLQVVIMNGTPVEHRKTYEYDYSENLVSVVSQSIYGVTTTKYYYINGTPSSKVSTFDGRDDTMNEEYSFVPTGWSILGKHLDIGLWEQNAQ